MRELAKLNSTDDFRRRTGHGGSNLNRSHSFDILSKSHPWNEKLPFTTIDEGLLEYKVGATGFEPGQRLSLPALPSSAALLRASVREHEWHLVFAQAFKY